jgi:hypothetical protein
MYKIAKDIKTVYGSLEFLYKIGEHGVAIWNELVKQGTITEQGTLVEQPGQHPYDEGFIAPYDAGFIVPIDASGLLPYDAGFIYRPDVLHETPKPHWLPFGKSVDTSTHVGHYSHPEETYSAIL